MIQDECLQGQNRYKSAAASSRGNEYHAGDNTDGMRPVAFNNIIYTLPPKKLPSTRTQ